MSKDIVEVIIPVHGIRLTLSDAMERFLDIHKIGVIGAIAEAMRLAVASDTRFDSNLLYQHINYTNYGRCRDVVRDVAYPKFSDAEAKDLYTRIITIVYDGLYPYLYIATRPLYRVTDLVTLDIIDYKLLDNAYYIKAEIDHLPF